MTGPRLAVPLLLAAALGAADPDDLTPNDLRLQVGLPPSNAEITSRRIGSQAEQTSTITWEESGRWSLQWVPPVARLTPQSDGMCILEITSTRLVSGRTATTDPLIARAVTGGLHLGLGWVVLQNTTLELTAFGNGGMAWQEGSDHYGSAWEVGARLGLTWAPLGLAGGRPLIGAALLGMYGQLQHHATLTNQEYDLTVTSKGYSPAVVLGWRF